MRKLDIQNTHRIGISPRKQSELVTSDKIAVGFFSKRN